MGLQLSLSQEEKELLTQSVEKLAGKLDLLVELFYTYFLQSDEKVATLFHHTHMDRQQNMFNVAIGVIVTNIENPDFLQIHIDKLIDQHRLYGVNDEFIQFFIESMSKTILHMFGKDDPIIQPWLKLINAVMNYFRSKI